MQPVNKALPVPDRGRRRGEVGGMYQAGRSESVLGAERNSAEIQSQGSLPIATQRDSPDSTTVRSGGSSSPQLQRIPSTLSMTRHSSYTPAVSSPLKPSSSRSSLNSGEGKPEPNEEDSRQESPGSSNSTGRPERKRGNLSPAQQLSRKQSATAVSLDQRRKPETPKHLEDLGRDYSRYPLSSPGRSPYLRAGDSNRPLLASSHPSSTSILRTTTNNPFSDSQANLANWGYPDDRIGALDPYFGGEKGFILYTNEVEADDKFHMPADDDDLADKPHWKDFMDRRSVVSALGGLFLILGLLCVFVVLPVLTFATHIYFPGRTGKEHAGSSGPGYGPAWAHVNNNSYGLLNNIRRGLVDPDTPESAKTRISTFDGSTLQLVFSDEFNEPNRTFYPGDDPFWTAADLWYGATQDFEWYDPDAVTTGNGTLQLRLDAFPNHNLQYRSGMLNSWNQVCFKGGVFEVSVSLAGPAGVPGLWPGVWSMGNLGRPGYKATTDGVWPYTYSSCDIGITPNQSSPDGLSHLPGQKLSSCTCKGEDHPSPGTGRGAPEIDILEGSVDPNNRIGVVTQSFQVAPFDVYYRPNADFMQMPNYETTQMNAYCGGPFQQAVSATTLLNNDWYDGEAYQRYAFEYIPGTTTGKIAWFVGEDQSFMMDGRAIGPNGNIAARHVSEEPMSMVLNLGFSGSWSEILQADLKFPTVMHIDYVRLYQKPGETIMTCDPDGYPTTDYIKAHPEPYSNPNLTVSVLSSELSD